MWKTTSMVGPRGALSVGPSASTIKVEEWQAPWGALSAGPAASTTEVEEGVDGGPHGGRCRWVWQHPPPRLKMTSRAGPLGGAAGASTTDVEDDVDGGPLRGHYWRVRQRPPSRLKKTSEVEDDRVLIPPCVQTLIGSCKVKHGK
jgi:hypothetical protein